MEFTMTISSRVRITEDEADEIFDAFGDHFDAASVEPHEIEVDGVVPQRQRLAYIMLNIRQVLGFDRAQIALEIV